MDFKDVKAALSPIITIDKSFLTEQAGQVAPQKLVTVSDGLRLVLGLQDS
jgi:hypothetical protein